MRLGLFLTLGLAFAGCGSSDEAGAPGQIGGGGTKTEPNSGGQPNDQAGAGGASDRGEIGPAIQIAPGQASLVGVTSDGWVIYRDADSLRAAELGDAATVQSISDRPGSVLIRGRVVFNWADVDWTLGVGDLSVWTAETGAHSVGSAPYAEALVAASEDGSTIVYSANTHQLLDPSAAEGGASGADDTTDLGGAGGAANAPEKVTDLIIATSDFSSEEVLIESIGIGSEATCGASLGFVGERLFVGWCESGSRAAKIERYDHEADTWSPTTIADDALPGWATDASGERVFYQSSAYSGYVAENGDSVLIDAGVSRGSLLPDGSAVLYTVGDQLRRTDLPQVNPVAIVTTGYKQPIEFSSDFELALYSATVTYEHGTERDLFLASTSDFNADPLTLVKQPVATLTRSSMTRDGSFVFYLTDTTPSGGTLHVVDRDGMEVALLPNVVEAAAVRGSLLAFTDNASDPDQYPVVADLKIIALGLETEPRLIEEKVLDGKNFQVDASGTKISFVRSGVDRDAEQPEHDGLFFVDVQ